MSRTAVGIATLLLGVFSAAARTETPLPDSVHGFIEQYCLSCHGAEKEKGDRAFHELAIGEPGRWTVDLKNDTTRHLLEDMLDQLNLGEMPPEKKEVRQPSPEAVGETTEWLTKTLLAEDPAEQNHETVLRRLNRREYRNTMEHLLGIHDLCIDPTSEFPDDEVDHGFTNIGEALRLSESHLDQHLKAAGAYLDRALHFGPRPEQKMVDIPFDSWAAAPAGQATTPWMYRLHKPGAFLDIGAGYKDLSNWIYLTTYPNDFLHRGGIAKPGYYTIHLQAKAINRIDHGYDPDLIPVDLSDPLQLGLYIATDKSGVLASGVNQRKRIGLWDLKDDKLQDYEVTVWLDQGAVPFLNWDNGPGPSDYWMRDVCKKHHTDIEFRGKQGAHAWHVVGKDAIPGRKVSDVWRGPRIRMTRVQIEGPLPETTSSGAQKRFFDGESSIEAIDIEQALLTFTKAAFRRPTTTEEIEPYLMIRETALSEGRDPVEALKLAMKAVLVSPDFLYLREVGTASGKLSAHELAARLSYFLWSSMPDEELTALADSGAIAEPGVLRKQASRMLADPKSKALIEGFGQSWLRLDKLGSMPPDSTKFPSYYRDGFGDLFLEETHRFLDHILRQNRPVSDFLQSDYSFLNAALARHYGIDGVSGSHFRRVTLKSESQRGGLLGQGSIQTLTANGVDTSPVVRGIWILEAILGTPPNPPPPDVEPLDSDTRGANTIRKQLEKHRGVETCNDCHSKIDPYGFPFEFYDAIGGYRENYYHRKVWNRRGQLVRMIEGPEVDGTGRLETGVSLEHLADLQRHLLQKEPQFRRALCGKLLAYATGRHLTFRDEHELEKMNAPQVAGFRDLVLSVVTSSTFASR